MSLTHFDESAIPKTRAQPLARLKTSSFGPAVCGLFILLSFFGGFGAWAFIAELDSAATSRGTIVVEGYRKTIQHLEGGIIDRILVKDGSLVEADQVLLELKDASLTASYNLNINRLHAAKALEARLLGERKGSDDLTFPAELVDAAAKERNIAQLLLTQRELFEERRKMLTGQLSILSQRVRQAQEEIWGLEGQIEASSTQLDLISEEIGDVQYLFDRGYAPKTRLLALKRAEAGLRGDIGAYRSEISRLEQAIGENELRILDLRNRRQTEIADELRAAQEEIAELEDRLVAYEDSLARLEIKAPIDGIVVGLKYHTVGGVVPPRMPILDIVPRDGRLVVETRISPNDIDVVEIGLPAQVNLTAYKRRETPAIDATVINVSADRLEDERTGAPYYQAFLELDRESLERLEQVTLQPGMPADVTIVTGKRRAIDYIVGPITSVMSKALLEQ